MNIRNPSSSIDTIVIAPIPESGFFLMSVFLCGGEALAPLGLAAGPEFFENFFLRKKTPIFVVPRTLVGESQSAHTRGV